MPSKYIKDYGSKSAPVWIIVNKPFDADEIKGEIFSCPMGFVFKKMLKDAGIDNYHIVVRRPELNHKDAYRNLVGEISHHKPPIIIPLMAAANEFCPELIPTYQKNRQPDLDNESEIEKYAGSIMVSPHLNYSHYIIPTFDSSYVIKNWKQRDIVVSIDLGKAREELIYYIQNDKLNPLEERVVDIDFDSSYNFERLINLLESWIGIPFVSNDIETIYPKKPTKTIPSQYYGILPGYPITIGLAPNPYYGISFNLFRDSKIESAKLWRVLAKLLWETPSIGQNFFNFDSSFYQMLGFRIDLTRCRDTMITHAVLWPELSHKLQFLARQYTRMKYWKDEGAGWSIKNMDKMKRYNCLDVMGTFDVYLKQMEELSQRPWLL